MRSHPRTPSDRAYRRSSSGRRRHALVLAIGVFVLLAGCSGRSSAGSDESTTTSTIDPAEATATYVDPAAPITTTVGKEFAIMLPADPGSGWRWVLAPIDNSRLIALGSHFSDDPDLLRKAESATTTSTTTTTRVRAGNPTTSSTSTTTVPAVLPLVQIISFASRAAGPATISLSYNQIAGAPQAENKVVTFTVQVVPETPTTTATPTTTTS